MWPTAALLLFIQQWGPLGNFILLSLLSWFVYVIRCNDLRHVESFIQEVKEDIKYIRDRLDRLVERYDGP